MSSRVNNNTNHTQQTIASLVLFIDEFLGRQKLFSSFAFQTKLPTIIHHPVADPRGPCPSDPCEAGADPGFGGPGSEAESC